MRMSLPASSVGVAVVVTAAILMGGSSFSTELLVNGGFESPSIPPDSYQLFTPSSDPGIPGWQVVGGDVDINSANVFGSPYEGSQWLDLNGQNPGSIEQSFPTKPGIPYVLRFAFANNAASGFETTGKAEVFGAVGDRLLVAPMSHEGSTVDDMNYTTDDSFFTANSNTTTVRFTSTSYGTSGIALDAVSVVEDCALRGPATPSANCDDGNPCTDDSCDPTLGCVHQDHPGASCEDGDPCTGPDACNGGGECASGPLVFIGEPGNVQAGLQCVESLLP